MTPTRPRNSREKATLDEVRLRLVRDNDTPPTNPTGGAFIFGLQDTKQQIVPAARGPDGRLNWDFTLRVKPGSDPEHPVFTGPFASSPVGDRFVYLSWRSVERGDYINRIKARLSGISWAQVRAAQAADARLVADMTGRRPGDPRKQVVWRLISS
jgi:hypothetical protein